MRRGLNFAFLFLIIFVFRIIGFFLNLLAVFGKSGMGTMEAGFIVVDFEIARQSIIDKFNGAQFADYLAIRDTDTLATADEIRAEA